MQEKDKNEKVVMNESVYTKIARFILLVLILLIVAYGGYWIYKNIFVSSTVVIEESVVKSIDLDVIAPQEIVEQSAIAVKETVPELPVSDVIQSVSEDQLPIDLNKMSNSLNVLLKKVRSK